MVGVLGACPTMPLLLPLGPRAALTKLSVLLAAARPCDDKEKDYTCSWLECKVLCIRTDRAPGLHALQSL